MEPCLSQVCAEIYRLDATAGTDYTPLKQFDSRLVVAYFVRNYTRNYVCNLLRGRHGCGNHGPHVTGCSKWKQRDHVSPKINRS